MGNIIHRMNFGTLFDRSQGRPAGFDYLRVGLSVAIMAFHAVRASAGFAVDQAAWHTWLEVPLKAAVPMFFALSGFLVAGSLERCRTLPGFLALRMSRIYPALMVDVLASALAIGPLVSDVPLWQYLSDPLFWRYLANITGLISFRLPGVFAANPEPLIVNVQLWTVPYELFCYVALSLVMLAAPEWRRRIVVCALAVLMAAQLARMEVGQNDNLAVPGRGLFLYFLGGVAAFQFRYAIPARPALLAAAAAVAAALLSGAQISAYLAIPAVVYVTVYLGLFDPRRTIISRAADISYGFYLYHYCAQQLAVWLFPEYKSYALTLAAGLVGGGLFAWASWVFVERPILSGKRRIMAWDEAIARRRTLRSA